MTEPPLMPRILERVREQRDDWIAFVERLALHESPSTDPAAQAHLFDLLGRSLAELGFRIRRVPGQSSGGLLIAIPHRRRKYAPVQLLIGHTDTVWPHGTLDSMPVGRDGDLLRGPGVFDMKAGLTQMVFALRALRDLDLRLEVEPVILINSDEEIGSAESTRHIIRMARRACRVFVLEPALGLEGRIKTARKGTGTFGVRVIGRGSHAGLAPEEGVSAIQELSVVVQRLHAFNDLDSGVLVNVGRIQGGTRPNVVAAEATAEVDVRVDSLEDGRRLEEQIRALRPEHPGCRIEVSGSVDRPPLERTPGNRALWQEARRLGEEMGVTLAEGRAGGASDGNTTNLHAPTLDGLGAVGDGAHASHEYVEVGRTLERCALLAGLLQLPERSPVS